MLRNKIIVSVLLVMSISLKSIAQYTTTWAFTNNPSGIKAGTQQADVTINDASIGTAFTSPGYSSNGVKCQPATDWITTPTDGWHIDFPISPNGNVDLTLTGLTFAARTSGSSGNNLVSLAVQADGVGAFTPFGTAQIVTSGGSSNINFGTLSRKLYGGHTYLVRMYIYAAGSTTSSSRSVSAKTVVFTGTSSVAGTQPSVTTLTAAATGKYTALATGVVTSGTLQVAQSGVVWGVAANPTVALTSKTITGPAYPTLAISTTGNINAGNGGDIAGLTAGTLYHARAYVISESGNVFYGADLSFTTNAPTAPVLTTNTVTNITSIKAISGGTISDSGGVAITAKGICWSTSPNPTITNAKTNDGVGNPTYASLLKILNPSTTYYVRAYATNSIGTAYGNELTFTTLAPEAVIITTTPNGQNSIPFGNVIVNNISPYKSYSLQANNLSPSSGSITITAPAGFEVSLNPASGYGSSLNIAYTSGSIAATTIYVRFLPTYFGNYSGTITHTGGGATTVNIDDVTVTGRGVQNPGEFSNVGMDFWVGYAIHNLMGSDGTSINSNGGSQRMVLYLSNSNPNATDVEVTIPGLSFTSGIINVPANSVYSYTIPNKIGTDYAQLYKEGKSAKGIHIVSQTPIVVYAHIYGNLVSGASLLLPTNTWGIDYYAASYNQNTTGGSSSGSYNYFFVVANEDNTQVEITPTVATLGGLVAGVKTYVTLNKGDIYNVLATKVGGEDVTGSRVRSLDCDKKIAVFSGSGRTGILGSCPTPSSDNLFAQVFPNAAWGNTYLTTPTQGTVPDNIYRIFVKDATTNVKINGATLPSAAYPATLTNNFYYEIKTDSAMKIEADKPITVSEYCLSTQGCSTPGIGNTSGDPEMIFLSPVQQAIDQATFYCPNNEDISFHYLNVIIPAQGAASFTLDGVNMSAKFNPHPRDNGYLIATLTNADGLTTGQHTIKAAIPFNAIVYGFGDATNGGGNPIRESYGYNAGTQIKALSQYLSVQNPYSNITNDSIISACKNNDFRYTVSLPYKPTYMKWDFFNNSAQLPNSDTVSVLNPLPADSSIVNGVKLYKYTLPLTYKFTTTGTFPVNITVNATSADGCTGLQTISFSVKVVEPPTANWYVVFNGCPYDIANFTDSSLGNGQNIVGWQWNFGGSYAPNTANIYNPTALYPSDGTYNVTLRAINDIGCFKDTTKPFIIKPGPKVTAVSSSNNGIGCVNTAYTFTATATTSLGVISKWYWSFGDGKKDTTTTNQSTHSYTAAGTYTIKVFVETSTGCVSDADSTYETIYQVVANFTTNSPQCLGNPIVFTNTSTGEIFTATMDTKWLWSFGDAANSTATTSSTSFVYAAPGTYNVKLKTSLIKFLTTEFCADDSTKQVTILPAIAKPVVSAGTATANSLTFNWTAVTGASGYLVSSNGGGTWTAPSSGATGLTHVLNGLTANTAYSLCVKASGTCPGDSACAVAKTLLPNFDIFVPTAFTPDGTGNALNEKLILCGGNIASLRFVAFNQWGEKIYETSNLKLVNTYCYEMWDGIANGKAQPSGVYAYAATVVFADGKTTTKKGMFNLMR